MVVTAMFRAAKILASFSYQIFIKRFAHFHMRHKYGSYVCVCLANFAPHILSFLSHISVQYPFSRLISERKPQVSKPPNEISFWALDFTPSLFLALPTQCQKKTHSNDVCFFYWLITDLIEIWLFDEFRVFSLSHWIQSICLLSI